MRKKYYRKKSTLLTMCDRPIWLCLVMFRHNNQNIKLARWPRSYAPENPGWISCIANDFSVHIYDLLGFWGFALLWSKKHYSSIYIVIPFAV